MRMRYRADLARVWRTIGAALLLAGVALQGCGRGPVPGPGQEDWVPLAPDAMTEDQTRQAEQAQQARSAMFERLQGELMQALETDGADGAIGICSEIAPAIAGEVSREFGLEIGRTSFRLRNPENAPPAWAAPHVAREVAEPRFLADPASGDLGALLPIRLQPACMLCHGPEDMIPEPVRQAIAEHYPDDRATGFQPDDLRGYFVVRVPSSEG